MIDTVGRYFPLDPGFEFWSECPEVALANPLSDKKRRGTQEMNLLAHGDRAN
jgi:hypothetical protein